jgi:DNA-binding transcriptional LysR family regulator
MAVTRDARVDLRLIHVLSVLITEQSVTRAAVRLNQTQPAVSAALRKLRQITNDKILVRGSGRYVATPRAQQLLMSSKRILAEFETMVSDPAPFSRHLKRRFCIGSLDYGGYDFLPNLIERSMSLSSQISIHIKSIGSSDDMVDHLETDELDCAITNWPSPPPLLRWRKIHEEDFALVMPSTHPLANRAFAIDDVIAYPHVAVTSAFQARRTVVDEYLHRENLRREIKVSIPAFSMIPDILVRSELLAIVGRSTALSFSNRHGLAVREMPIKLPKARLYILWHARHHDMFEHKWLRRTITDVWHDWATEKTVSAPRALSHQAGLPQ